MRGGPFVAVIRYTKQVKREQAGWINGFWVGVAVAGVLVFIIAIASCPPMP